MSNFEVSEYQSERPRDLSGYTTYSGCYTTYAAKSEPQRSPLSMSNIPETLFDVQGVNQSEGTHIHDMSNTGSREHFDPSDGCQLSASCQMSLCYNPPQDHPSPSHGMRQPPSSPPTVPQDGTSRLTEEPSIYVNAKQLRRILHGRAAREQLAQKPRRMDSRTRKPYVHKSRHQHAATRPKGPGGKFLSREEMENLRSSSQERTDGIEARVSPNSPSEHRFAMKRSSHITKDMTMSFYGPEELEDLHKKYSTKRPQGKLHKGEEE